MKVTSEKGSCVTCISSRGIACRNQHVHPHEANRTQVGGLSGARLDPQPRRKPVRRAAETEARRRVSFELIGNVLKIGRSTGDLVAMVENGEIDFCYLSTVRFTKWVP